MKQQQPDVTGMTTGILYVCQINIKTYIANFKREAYIANFKGEMQCIKFISYEKIKP